LLLKLFLFFEFLWLFFINGFKAIVKWKRFYILGEGQSPLSSPPGIAQEEYGKVYVGKLPVPESSDSYHGEMGTIE
jgi:hypothetical protein